MMCLLHRDFTIIAKTHHDLARHYRAVARTCRQALDDTMPDLLPPPVREEDVATITEPSLQFGSGSEEDHD